MARPRAYGCCEARGGAMIALLNKYRLLTSKVLRRGARLIEPKSRTNFGKHSRMEVEQRSPHRHLEWETAKLYQALADEGIELVAQPSGSSRLKVFGIRAADLEQAIAAISRLKGEWSV